MNFDEINVLALEEAFYSKKFHFSYSSLSKLLYSPKLFYSQYVLNQREEKLGAHLIEGKVIHCLLLEPEKFNEKFMVSPLSLPSENSKAVIDKVFQHAKQNMLLDSELKSLDSVIIDILKEANLHQSLKTDEQRVDKIVTDQTISYYSFLKEKEGKDVIDTETYTKCKESVEVLKQNPDVEISLGLGLNSAAVDIYRACNFQYYGLTDPKKDFYYADGTKHSRGSVKGVDGEWRERSRKHRYVMVFDFGLNVLWKKEPFIKKDANE